jgi:hypothetical protein
LLKDDKRYYQAKLVELSKQLEAEQARSAEKDKVITALEEQLQEQSIRNMQTIARMRQQFGEAIERKRAKIKELKEGKVKGVSLPKKRSHH